MMKQSRPQTNVKYFRTAGITVEVRSDFPISANTFHPKFRQFEVSTPSDVNVCVRHHFHSPDLSTLLKDASNIYDKIPWRIFAGDDFWLYQYTPEPPEYPGYPVTAIFNHNYTVLSAFTSAFNVDSYRNARLPALSLFNNDQLMLAPLLFERNGLILHANGFDIKGNGVLLTGASGVGKSTLSSFLKGEGFEILCDDRMFITKTGNDFFIHGNWCHGTVSDTSPGTFPLKAIFFLEQSSENRIEAVHCKTQILHALLRSLVHPLSKPDGWHKALDLIEVMVRHAKCYKVGFDLSGRIAKAIKKFNF